MTVDGEEVDNPDDYKGEPIPGGPTDPNAADPEGLKSDDGEPESDVRRRVRGANPTTTKVGGMTPLSDLQEEISPARARELHEAGEVQLVDVREQDEWDAGRITGARHVPVAQLSEQAESLDRDRPVVFYCLSGSRSAMATQAFNASGFDAHNMTGGIAAWNADGLPMDGRGGRALAVRARAGGAVRPGAGARFDRRGDAPGRRPGPWVRPAANESPQPKLSRAGPGGASASQRPGPPGPSQLPPRVRLGAQHPGGLGIQVAGARTARPGSPALPTSASTCTPVPRSAGSARAVATSTRARRACATAPASPAVK